MDWVAIRAALQQWVVSCTGLSDQKVIWGRQRNAPRPAEDAIVMKLYVVDDIGMSWVDTEDKLLSFSTKTITDVTGNDLEIVGHELVTGDGWVTFAGADLPAPLEEDTHYWVIRVDDDHIRVAAQYEDTGGGDATGNPITPITLTDTGSGSITLSCGDGTLRAGEEINFVQRGVVRATLQLFAYVQDDTGINGAIATLRRVANRHKLPTNKAILEDVGVAVASMERTRSMLGMRDAVLFEPRAWLDIELLWNFEERETGTIIGRVSVQREAPEPVVEETIENEDL